MLKFIPSAEKPWIENYAILLRLSHSSSTNQKPRMIGTVGALRLSSEEDTIEIAYGLHSHYWGSGYASEALGMFIKLYWAAESTICGPPSLFIFIRGSFKDLNYLPGLLISQFSTDRCKKEREQKICL